MGDSDGIPEEERRLFREAMAEVRPIASEQRAPDERTPRPEPRPRQREADDAAARSALATGALDDPDLEVAEELAYARAGIQERVLRRLRRGHYAMQAVLDLHGLSRAEAAEALAAVLADCRARGLTGVRIIPGKGRRSANEGPVLRPAVATWLRRRAEVLAFCTARPVDGGAGALYVLLARR